MFRVISQLIFCTTLVACADDGNGPVGDGGNGGSVVPDSVEVFLDIRSQVRYDGAGGEVGLLGLAFHPNFAGNGFIYVYYSTTGTLRSRLSRFKVSGGDPNRVDPSSERVLLDISEPFPNHNAGALVFGPDDGMLYVSVGDGGGAGDPEDYGQDRTSLHGSILRIDVDQNVNASPYYGIPPDNPYAGNTDGYREEIWAYGFRNPWRMSFDPVTGWLWAADVGQDRFEEIDIVEKGMNYGWDCREGTWVYDSENGNDPGSPSPACTTGAVFAAPIHEYSHAFGLSITGGYVYRGDSLSSLVGRYVYADWASKRIWALSYDGVNPSQNEQIFQAAFFISAIGQSESGELYFLNYYGGRIRTMREVEDPPGTFTYALYEPWPALQIANPVGLYTAGDGSNRLFVLEQAGRIFVFSAEMGSG